MPSTSRRDFFAGLVGLPLLGKAIAFPDSAPAQTEKKTDVPIRALTKGPYFHWFGYYDKWQLDPTDRYVLGNEVHFQGRALKAPTLFASEW